MKVHSEKIELLLNMFPYAISASYMKLLSEGSKRLGQEVSAGKPKC